MRKNILVDYDMDWNYVRKLAREDITKQCPQLPDKIVDEYLDLTFFRSNWVNYCNEQKMYIIGIVESRYDFYYIGFDDSDNIRLASSALEFRINEDRNYDFIIDYSNPENGEERWRTIRKKLNDYLESYPDNKLIYFQDIVLSDEHLVYDNEDKTKAHIEKIKY